MQTLIKISDAAVIAVHSMDYMLRRKKTSCSAREMSEKLGVSYNHLSKVLQRLAGENFISPFRGPSGGYYITDKGQNARLGEIISVIEGERKLFHCLLNPEICGRKI